jgi:hypothetical protein
MNVDNVFFVDIATSADGGTDSTLTISAGAGDGSASSHSRFP